MAFVYGIYRNGELRYVGKTVRSIRDRMYAHYHEARSGRKFPLADFLRKYDPTEIEVVVLEEDQWGNLDEAEKAWIALARSHGCRLLNLLDGGNGWTVGQKHTDESKAKMSAWHKQKTLSATHREQIRERMTGRVVSEETRKKLSDARRGRGVHSCPSRASYNRGCGHAECLELHNAYNRERHSRNKEAINARRREQYDPEKERNRKRKS